MCANSSTNIRGATLQYTKSSWIKWHEYSLAHFNSNELFCCLSCIKEFPNCVNSIGNHMYHLGGSIRNHPCTLGRPIQNCPCILWRPRQSRLWILGGTIQNTCLAKCMARISNILSAHWAFFRQVQARTSVRMHSVKANVMPKCIVTFQN